LVFCTFANIRGCSQKKRYLVLNKGLISKFKRTTHKRKNKYMKLLLITFALLGLGIAGIAIKIWAKKDGKFAGTCASQNPMLNKEGDACGFCGKTPEQYENCAEPTHN
jgi:hypothetical protein